MAMSKEVLLREGGLMTKTLLDEFANAVCLITVKRQTKRSYGSGFYTKVQINGKHYYGVFTNNHVLRGEREAEDAEVVFCYEERGTAGKSIRLQPDLLFKTNVELDYSLVGVNKADLDALNLSPVEFLKEPKVSKGDVIYIWQHPKGRPKEFSCEKIQSVQLPFVYYKADTDAGSSGSPVFFNSSLLAVHHRGSEELQYNKGTLCSEILSHLHGGEYTMPRDFEQSGNETQDAVDGGITWRTNKVVDDELQELAEHLIGDWRRLASKLGVDRKEVKKIREINKTQDQAYTMLEFWVDSKGNITYEVLGEALVSLSKFKLAKEFCGSK